ncbi:uncharacterized protein si:dkey-250d21.1 isoform X2 [Triplophysa dalaica]|uniref:uncharacterized protein si:dkey-250d21.1 isoform X2 n=1 Tax=Triplophysa dalaica TaxID=1582913 RepID=UPI0024DFF2A7|nr:uncharacterized protein si:dkey-250d21.1 isoform X2 [Triplophysa dalaica]
MSKMPDSCAAASCKQSTDQSNVFFFFRFPLDPNRCKQWVSNCSRPDLKNKTPEYLHKNYKLCSKHFETSMLRQQSTAKPILKDDAVPTIFDQPTNKDKAENSSRKRTREKAAEEPVVAKKTKGTADNSQRSIITAEDTVENVPVENVENVPVENVPVENSATHNLLAPDESEKEDPAISKVKETLKDYFKETLAFTGFNIGSNAIPNSTKPLGSDPAGPLSVNTICAEKIDPKEVLTLGEDVMHKEICNSLRLARFFSILLQDKIQIEDKDQIPFFIRFVTAAGFPHKHLVGFLPCDIDSDSLFNMLISEISNKWGLRMEHCRGFTYLTTGSVCQKLKELSCRMLRDFPQVVLAPSEPYAFNMWLIRTMPVLSIQDVIDTLEEVAAVIRQSETLARKLEIKITSLYGHIKGEVDRVKDACQNHWEYATDAFQTMLDILEPFLNSIGEMCTSSLSNVDADTVEVLLKLKDKMKNFNFIVTLVVLKNTLCCVSILNPSLRGIISISSTLQYTISNALKLLTKHLQEIAIFHRKWFSDALGRAKKLGVPVGMPAELVTNGEDAEKPQISLEDYYRETLSKKVLQYLADEVKRVLGTEMVRILRWLSLVPSYMADHNFSIRKDKVADANLNNLARPDSFYDELGCWEVKWRHASKRRILPTNVFATLKIPDIGFYPNVQSLLRVLGTIPCVTAEADVYGQYEMVLNRYHSYMKEVPVEKRLCNMALVYVNQDVHFNIEEMVDAYVEKYPDILQLLQEVDAMEVEPSVPETIANDTAKDDTEEPREMTLSMETERPKPPECAETDKEALKSALQAAVTAAYGRQSKHTQGDQEMDYVTKSEMNEVLKVCEDVVRDRIITEVGRSFFSLFIDRVVRLGEIEYLPMFLRFVDSFDIMRLELLGFVEVSHDTDTMSERLFDAVTKDWRLNLSNCRGQAYLGSGEVSYKLKAFACKIQERQPLAICTHCSCYSFNTWWSRSVPVAAVIRAIDTLEEIVSFFQSLPFLEKQLDQVLAIGLRESYEKIHELQGKFCSSWLEKHDSYEVFAQILEPLAMCLENIDDCKPQGWSLAVSNRAKKLLQLIRDFDFIVAIVALKNASSFTRELSAALQKDHFSAASQLCQISGILATLHRVKTNIKVFHQNWFDEACVFAQNLGVQVKMPDNVVIPRDSLLKPGVYYKDAMSVPLVDYLINMVKDYFSDDHKEALNFLSLVPCSVTMSYVFETLKLKPPLYIGDLPDPDNFFTELSCWKVKWNTKVVSETIPETIFQTLRLPLMQYFSNINTLLKILCVLPSTALEYCGEVKRHKMYQDFLSNTSSKDRSPCLAMLQVGTDFKRDLDKMVAQCLKVTPKTLEGICLDKESRTLGRTVEMKTEDDHHMDVVEVTETLQGTDPSIPVRNSETTNRADTLTQAESTDGRHQSEDIVEVVIVDQQLKNEEETNANKNGHSDEPVDNIKNCEKVFKQAAVLARRNCSLVDLSKEEQDAVLRDLASCHWIQQEGMLFLEGEMLQCIVKAIREQILSEVQDSPFFSIITDRPISVGETKFLPVFVRYVNDCIPKVELVGFLPFEESSDVNLQAKALSSTLEAEWGLQMGYCRGQSIMCIGTGGQSLRKMALGLLENYPLAVNTPSESCGLAYWQALSLKNSSVTKVLEIAEDLLQFFDQSPKLENELAKTMDGLLNTPQEALGEIPETCLSRWKKREDFFDILVDMLEGALNCLDSVSTNNSGSWSSNMLLHSQTLSTAIRQVDFVIPLVILKNACAPLRNCSTVFRCGNPADIVCELEKIMPIIDSLGKMLENVSAVHSTWFEEAVELAVKVTGLLSYPESVNSYESPEAFYMETVSLPVLNGLIEEMKFNFSENHLKALKVLSLLPTCNPLPILPESTEKLHTIYLSDLPEQETAEEDINTWATVWREKYQDVSPPTSISETLLHSEAKQLPNVATLLKLVAVLPSISMECDLMKTTLNSLRTLLRDGIFNRGSKTDAVMLLMHRQTLQSLEEIIEKCMENDLESHQFLAQAKARVNHLRMESEVIAMAPKEISVDVNGSGYFHDAKDAGTDVNTAPTEEVQMEKNGSTEILEAEEPSTRTPDPQSSSTIDTSDKPATTIQVIPASSPLPVSTPEQPTQSVQDASMQSTSVVQTDQLVDSTQHQDTNGLEQCEAGLSVQTAAYQLLAIGQDGAEQEQMSDQLLSVDQGETMEVDHSENYQFVAADESGTDQPASLQIVPDPMIAADHTETDLSVEPCHTAKGLAEEGGTGQLVSGDPNEYIRSMAVDQSVNEELVSANQGETDQVMEVDKSDTDQTVATNQNEAYQSEAAEHTVETVQSIVELQVENETAPLVSLAGIESGQLVDIDPSGKDENATHEAHQSGTDEIIAVGQVEFDHSVAESEASQTEAGLANETQMGQLVSEVKIVSEQLIVVDYVIDPSVTADHGVADQLVAVEQVETDNSMIESQHETVLTEAGLADEVRTGHSISEDQNASDQLMVVDSGIDQSVTDNQSVTDDVVAHVRAETDISVVEGQKTSQIEAGLANKAETGEVVSEEQNGSDQLMIVDSEIDQTVTADQSIADQLVNVGQVETDHSVVEGQSEAGQTEAWLANEVETGQLLSEDQLMVVDSGIDLTVTADQSVADQLVNVGQIETDHSVVEGQSEAGQTEAGLGNVETSQLESDDQLMVVDSGNDQSVGPNHGGSVQSIMGDQSVPDQFVVVSQVETDQSITDGQNDSGGTETELASEERSGQLVGDQLMVVDSGNYQSEDHGETGQSVMDQTDQFVAQVAAQPVVEGQSGDDRSVTGVVDLNRTSQIVSTEQSGTDRLMADEVQSVVGTQDGIIPGLSDQFVPFGQSETDQIVPGNSESGTDHSQSVDQVGPDQLEVAVNCGTDQLDSVPPDGSDHQSAEPQAQPDQPSAIILNHSMSVSPVDITDHPTAAQSEEKDQSTAKAQESTDKDTGPEQKVLTLYNTSAREKLLKELCDVQYFTIVAEEELKIDGQPYIPVGIHYLNKQDVQCENILAFIPLATDIALFVDILTTALSQKWGLNLAFCRGQVLARPGASVSQMRQASSLLSQRLPHALSFLSPLTPMSLLASLSSLRVVKHSFKCFEQLLKWFSEDDQRQVRLHDAVVHLFQTDESKASELKSKLGSSQWAMSHEILDLTVDILEAVFYCLNEMRENGTEVNAAQAQSFLSVIQNFDFVLTVVIMRNILSLTKNLNQSLQGNSCDVYQAVSSLSDVLSPLSEMKSCIESHHQTWFQEAVALASKLQVIVQHPSLQPPSNVHYREDISREAIEYCIAEAEGLSQDVLSALHCLQVVPYVMSKVEGCCKDIELVRVFQDDLPDPNSFQDELQRWKDRWHGSIAAHQHLPDTVLGTLQTSDIQSFPNILTILRLLAALPWSSVQSSFRQGYMSSEFYPL